ncbi:MAG TPA: glutathione S-transferase family protein [Gammaproteobacteria bacterium]|nr:glutathione S-transferase family protein [Gammaproteobacteria bacterium]HIL94899.1 glutathione S-transferase family protein [Pseudomonadales bacterium]
MRSPHRLFQMQDSGNCYKIRLLMTLLELPFEIIDIDILKGESRAPGFLKKNPVGRVPVLQLPDGHYLAESNTILWYLAAGTPYFPSSKFDQALVFQWMGFEQYSHEPFIATSRFWISILGQPQEYARQIAEKRAPGYAALAVMEQHLSKNQYFVTDKYTIADIALYAYTHVADEGGFKMTNYPAIRLWLDRVRSSKGHIPIEHRQR